MNKTAIIIGGFFGLIAPFVGIFLGLQVSTILGDILAFPVIGLVYVTGTPFGMWEAPLMIVAFALSIVLWALIFGLIARLLKRR